MIVHTGISMAMAVAMAVSMGLSVRVAVATSVPMGLSVRMAVATSFTTHPVALHGAAFSVARASRLCLGLNLGLNLGLAPTPRRGLSAAQLLRTPFDFGHARRIGAFTNAALGRLRKGSRGSKQQRQHDDGYPIHFHDDLSLTGDGLLSDKSANWFL